MNQLLDRKTVNIIGGFLGAGKTTLVNHILTSWAQGRTDVLVREYGSVSIDDQLLRNVSGNVHVFPGITVHDDPQLVLYDYLHGVYVKSAENPFDHLLLEASGLDQPESLVQLFMVGHMPTHYVLGSFIVVVDAEYGLLNLDEYEVATRQVAFADAIVINKVDLADEQTIGRLERRIRSINGMARLHRACFGQVELEPVMNITIHQQLRELTPTTGERPMGQIGTVTLSESRPMDKEKVNAWITGLFEERGSKILRSKGFFWFAGEDWRYEFQGVRKSFHSKADRLWQDDEERKTVVVLIGEELPDQQQLAESFAQCVESRPATAEI